jgi:hypothetical protein
MTNAKSIADSPTLQRLLERLGRLNPDAQPQWGTLTANEMLCHLGDAHESVLGIRVPPTAKGTGRKPPPGPLRPLLKWLVLYSPVGMPKGAKTRPGVDPRLDGTKPAEFERDRARAIRSLKDLAVAPPGALGNTHFLFGPMSPADWYQWAGRHVDHHLRQFGV